MKVSDFYLISVPWVALAVLSSCPLFFHTFGLTISTSSFQLRMRAERWARRRLYTPPLAPATSTTSTPPAGITHAEAPETARLPRAAAARQAAASSKRGALASAVDKVQQRSAEREKRDRDPEYRRRRRAKAREAHLKKLQAALYKQMTGKSISNEEASASKTCSESHQSKTTSTGQGKQ